MKPGFPQFCRERQCQKSGNGFPLGAAGGREKRQSATESRRQINVIFRAGAVACALLVAWHLATIFDQAFAAQGAHRDLYDV
ncbi:hypothetical protein ACX3YG_19430 [Pseudomonas wadenswilerensis]